MAETVVKIKPYFCKKCNALRDDFSTFTQEFGIGRQCRCCGNTVIHISNLVNDVVEKLVKEKINDI